MWCVRQLSGIIILCGGQLNATSNCGNHISAKAFYQRFSFGNNLMKNLENQAIYFLMFINSVSLNEYWLCLQKIA